MGYERAAGALCLVERQGCLWFDAVPEETAAVSDLLDYVKRAVASLQGSSVMERQKSVHAEVLAILQLADLAGRNIVTDSATSKFCDKCCEHSDYLGRKFAERRLPLPWLLSSGIPAEILDADARREIATVVRETVNHLANHARETLPFTQPGAPAHSERATDDAGSPAARNDASLRFVSSADDSSKQRRYMYVGNETAIVEMHNNCSLFLDLRDLSLVPTLLQTGWWEPWIEQVLRSILLPGMCYVNAGANVGYHSCLGAKLVEHTGKVFIFEPNPHVFKLLRRSIFYNGFSSRASLFNAAVSNETGQVRFYVCNEQAGGGEVFDPRHKVRQIPPHELAEGEETFSYDIDAFESFDVARLSLDDTVGRRIDELDVLQMDIEGSEGAAILGARNLIGRSRNLRIILEWSAGGRANDTVREQHRTAAAFLSDCGFKFYRIAPPPGNVFSNPPSLTHIDVKDLMNLPHSDLLLMRA